MKSQTKRTAKIWLCISIALMFISMIGASVVQTNFGDVTIKQLSIETDAGFYDGCRPLHPFQRDN